MVANSTEAVKLATIPSTGGFAGITVDPTSFVYAAVQVILAQVAYASNGATKASAILVMGPLPYVEIHGIAGSPFNLATGAMNISLPQQYMITAMGCAITPYTALLWSAVANYLFQNPTLLHADGFSATRTSTSDGKSIIDMIPN